MQRDLDPLHDVTAVTAKVAEYPEGLRAAAKTLVEAGDKAGLESLKNAAGIANAALKANADPGAGDDEAGFDDMVKARMKKDGITKSAAELLVGIECPELLAN